MIEHLLEIGDVPRLWKLDNFEGKSTLYAA